MTDVIVLYMVLSSVIERWSLVLPFQKQEATDQRTLIAVQNAIISFFKIEKWKEAITKFETMVDSDKLLRFTVSRERLYLSSS